MKFKIGDKVRYELSHFTTPRWFANRDYGGTGMWEEGTVTCLYHDKVEVLGQSGLFIWPMPGHPEYDDAQWSRPGFIQKVGEQTTTTKTKSKCVCGAHTTYGSSCNLHSNWCDLYQE